jgi:hypothetical protein
MKKPEIIEIGRMFLPDVRNKAMKKQNMMNTYIASMRQIRPYSDGLIPSLAQ